MSYWIKYRGDDILAEPQTLRLSRALKKDVYTVASRLGHVWAWAGRRMAGGRVAGAGFADVDQLVRCRGFAAAMAAVGWLAADGEDLVIPKWERYFARRPDADPADARVNPNTERSRRRRAAAADAPPMQRTCTADATPDPLHATPVQRDATHDATHDATPCTADATPGGGVGGEDLDLDQDSDQDSEKNLSAAPAAAASADLFAPDNSRPANAKAKAKAPRKPPTGEHQEAVDGFSDAWQRKYRERYPFNGDKDGSAVKFVLGQCNGDLAKFLAVVGRFLADDDPFFAAADRHTLPKLRQHFARWLVPAAATPAGGARPPPKSADEVWAEMKHAQEATHGRD